MTELDKALALAQLGLSVFPVRKTKAPFITDWPNAATADEETITKWWKNYPSALVGVATGASGLVVVDVDYEEGSTKDGYKTLEGNGLTLDTFWYNTRRGGAHAIYKAPEGVELRNGTNITLPDGRQLPSVDMRAVGGFVIWWSDKIPESVAEFKPTPDWLNPKPKIEPDVSKYADLAPEPDVYPADTFTEAVKAAIKTANFFNIYAEFVPHGKIGRNGKEQQFSCPNSSAHEHGDLKNPSASIDLSTGEWCCHKPCGAHGDLIALAAIGLGFNNYQSKEEWPKFIEEAGERLGIIKESEPALPAPDAGPKVLAIPSDGNESTLQRLIRVCETARLNRLSLPLGKSSTENRSSMNAR